MHMSVNINLHDFLGIWTDSGSCYSTTVNNGIEIIQGQLMATVNGARQWKGVLCRMRIAEFRKGVFCGSKIAENVLVVKLCQLNKCTILQSAQLPCS